MIHKNITNTNDEIIDDTYTDTVTGVDNTDNAAIDAENVDNSAIDVENTDNAAINADNTSNVAKDSKKSDDATMSDNSTDNAAMSDSNTDYATTGNKIWIILQQVRLVLHTYPCLHIMVEKPKIQAKFKPPQSKCLLLQNLQ